ncbi:S-layer homology domain-containing protein [Niallia endozanthoxylica]|uniref:S-layer homology domain-containing protein n=1 Tax=Niallia endozanthoxylica TaxID=2036016 RepID=A0A5J5HQF4_9BACI|nr:S-layer homology domain-containing protein [Niallia endozanthoxylica]KAA9023929.1 S-layer homology domain-containing protein [Niallia endozanthoxylica]
MKKAIYIVVALLILNLFVPISGLAVSSFTDVSNDYTFFDEVGYLSSKGIISGYPDGSFRANNTVTRAQAAIMIGRALGLDGGPRDTQFIDVKSNVTGSGYIASAVDRGIISGFPDGSYRPYEPVNRGQMAIFINRAYTLTTGQTSIYFSDVSLNMSAYQSILNVATNGIASGYPDSTYRPNQSVSRGQFSAFMARTLEPSYRGLPNEPQQPNPEPVNPNPEPVNPEPEPVNPNPEPVNPEPTTTDNSRSSPARIGETVNLEKNDWLDGHQKYEIELKEVISGDKAWQIVKNANMFNDPPDTGMKYVLAKFRIKIWELEEEPYDINHAKFDAVSKEGVLYDQYAFIAGLKPSLSTDLYEGAEYEGWTYFMVNENDEPLAVFNQGWDDETWFDISE